MLHGEVVGMEGSSIRFKTAAGTVSFSREGVESIAFGKHDAPKAQPVIAKSPPPKSQPPAAKPPAPQPKSQQLIARPITNDKPKSAKADPGNSGEVKPADVKIVQDPPGNSGAGDASKAQPNDQTVANAPPESPDDMLAIRKCGLAPESVKPSDVLLERDLTAVIGQIMQKFGKEGENPITPSRPASPVSRIRTLVAIVKIGAALDDVEKRRAVSAEKLTKDAETIPTWARPYVALAVEQGWLSADKPLNGQLPATWQFLGAVLAKTPYVEEAPQHAAPPRESESYTGLIIDAREVQVERCMSARILTKTGEVVYPDPAHLPDLDFVEQQGMTSYTTSPDETKRVGKNPLVVKAVDTASAGNDVVVSDEDAAQIRAANKRGKFLWKWAISILTAMK